MGNGGLEPSASAAQYGAVLAYNSVDNEHVFTIYNELKRRALFPWIDKIDGRPGADWQESFVEALDQTSAVVVFFGPTGPGKWQDEEMRFIHQECVNRKLHLVPVLLPGGELPRSMLFSTRDAVRFEQGTMDQAAYDKLEFGITGRNPERHRGKFDILATVDKIERNCFLAVSHATSPEVYKVMSEAAKDVGLIVTQPREYSTDKFNVYSPEAAVAIRSAMIILADGTPDSNTDKPDADVMYEVGLAEAFAKPMVFVSTEKTSAVPLPIFVCDDNCSPVVYDPNELNYLARLRDELADRLREILTDLRPPHLVPPNEMGLHVAYSEVFLHRAEIWKPIESILHFGLTIKHEFGSILKDLHHMQPILDHIQEIVEQTFPLDLLETPLQKFCDAYNRFRSAGDEENKTEKLINKENQESSEAFDTLLTLLSDNDGTDQSVRTIVSRSRRSYNVLEGQREQFCDAQVAFDALVNNPDKNILHFYLKIQTALSQLTTLAESIPAQACAMMFGLIDLFGMRNEHGGC